MKWPLPHLICVVVIGMGSIAGAIADTAAPATLIGKAAAEKLIGNTLEGLKPATGAKRAMYFRPDGALFTHNPQIPFDFPVIRWSIIGDQMCLAPEIVEANADICASVEVKGNTVNFLMPDASPDVINTLLPGNHYNKK